MSALDTTPPSLSQPRKRLGVLPGAGAQGLGPSLLSSGPFLPTPKAEACKSIEYAMKKCPNGMFSEIKYDGERVQVHKSGDHFSYFSRSLKPVLPHKVGPLPPASSVSPSAREDLGAAAPWPSRCATGVAFPRSFGALLTVPACSGGPAGGAEPQRTVLPPCPWGRGDSEPA